MTVRFCWHFVLSSILITQSSLSSIVTSSESINNSPEKSINIDAVPESPPNANTQNLIEKQVEWLQSELRQLRIQNANEVPRLRVDLERQKQSIGELRNLSDLLVMEMADARQRQELHKIVMQDYKQQDVLLIENQIEQIRQDLTAFHNENKWIHGVISDLKRKMRDLMSRTNNDRLSLPSPAINQSGPVRLVSADDLIDMEGSGEQDHEQPPPKQEAKTLKECSCAQYDARLEAVESALQQVLGQRETEKSAPPKSELEPLVVSYGNMPADVTHKLNGLLQQQSISKETYKKLQLDTEKEIGDLRTSLVENRQEAERARGLAQIVKEIQVSHFGVIQDLQQDVSIMETDNLRQELKLTKLQAHNLNISLIRSKQSENNLRQNLQIQALSNRLLQLEQEHATVVRDLRLVRSELQHKTDYSEMGRVAGTITDLNFRFGQQSRALGNTSLLLGGVIDDVKRIERQLPIDCAHEHNMKRPAPQANRVLLVRPMSSVRSVEVRCQGHWTLIQSRTNGHVSFNQTYEQYVNGFGQVESDHWLGLENIRLLANNSARLRVRTWDVFGVYRYADYGPFGLSNAAGNYRSHFGQWRAGNLSDALSAHNGQQFSAFDVDRDVSSTHCARYYASGWWFAHCQHANVNGNFHVGMVWLQNTTNQWLQFARTELLITTMEL